MAALKPPFRANDMNGLYKRVLRGQYPPIDKSYSPELAKVLAAMLRVEPKQRPSCAQILEFDYVLKKCAQLGISCDDEYFDANEHPGSREGGRPGSNAHGSVEDL